MRPEWNIRNDSLRNKIRSWMIFHARIFVLPIITIRPSIKAVFFDVGKIIWYEFIPELVTFIYRCPQYIRPGGPAHAARITAIRKHIFFHLTRPVFISTDIRSVGLLINSVLCNVGGRTHGNKYFIIFEADPQ